jgi:hypothetical protein
MWWLLQGMAFDLGASLALRGRNVEELRCLLQCMVMVLQRKWCCELESIQVVSAGYGWC